MAIRINNTNQDLDSGTPGILFSASQPNTQMVWMNKSVYVGVSRQSLIGCYNTSASTAFQFGVSDTTTFAVWEYGGVPFVTYPSNLLPVNNWIFMTYTWDGVNSRFWINGVVVNTSTIVPVAGNINQVWVNSFPPLNVSERANDYSVADYRLYNRLLSENEITTIYNLRGKDNITLGLVGRWPFNEGPVNTTVSSARDISLNKHNLTVTNTPIYTENNLSVIPGIS